MTDKIDVFLQDIQVCNPFFEGQIQSGLEQAKTNLGQYQKNVTEHMAAESHNYELLSKDTQDLIAGLNQAEQNKGTLLMVLKVKSESLKSATDPKLKPVLAACLEAQDKVNEMEKSYMALETDLAELASGYSRRASLNDGTYQGASYDSIEDATNAPASDAIAL